MLRTEDLMQDRYLENDYITVPSDDYEIHINKLQKMAQNAKDEKVRDKAKLFLSKLQKGNFTREEAMNPRFTAIKQQVKQTANNIGQTAFSDGVNMALSTLASGFVAEVRLYYSGKSTETLWEHMYRLFTKTLEDFKQGISRGAGFAGVEIVISTISTLFKSMFSNIKMIWGSLRGSFKSIYNGIYDYIKGKIKTKADLFKIILKSLASAIGVFGIAIIETKLSGFVGSILAGAISIIIGSFIVVSIPKMVDYLISLFNPASIAIKKMNEIIELCDRELTLIIEQHQELEAKINQVFIDRSSELNMSFESLYTSISNKDIKASFSSFFNINKLYGKKLSWGNKEELSKFLESDDTLEL